MKSTVCVCKIVCGEGQVNECMRMMEGGAGEALEYPEMQCMNRNKLGCFSSYP